MTSSSWLRVCLVRYRLRLLKTGALNEFFTLFLSSHSSSEQAIFTFSTFLFSNWLNISFFCCWMYSSLYFSYLTFFLAVCSSMYYSNSCSFLESSSSSLNCWVMDFNWSSMLFFLFMMFTLNFSFCCIADILFTLESRLSGSRLYLNVNFGLFFAENPVLFYV